MTRTWAFPDWLTVEHLKPALLAGVLLFIASYVTDLFLAKFSIQASSTILNDLAIALLGSVLLLSYMAMLNERRNLARARERILLVARLNHQIRGALFEIGKSAMLEDQEERLRAVDRAMYQIDDVLTDLVPTMTNSNASRLTVPDMK